MGRGSVVDRVLGFGDFGRSLDVSGIDRRGSGVGR